MDKVTYVRKRLNRKQWKTIIKECRSSGMTTTAWCIKMKLTKRFSVLLLLALTVNGIAVTDSVSADAAAKKVSLSTKDLTVKVGQSKKLKLKNNKKKVTWKVTSGKKNITLRGEKKTGVTIVGKKKGTAKVQATIGKKKLTCKITVKKNNNMDFSSKASVEVGDTLTLKLSGNTKSVDWKVDNPKCLRVKESGKSKIILVGVNSGTVRVSAKIGEQKKTCDVKYVNEEYYRVNGGYICSSNSALGDGGKLKMQRTLVYNQNGYQEHKMYGNSETYLYGVQYEDTAITVNCPTVKTHLQYLIDESGQAEKSFFEQLDCLQKKLNELVVYPDRYWIAQSPIKELRIRF